MNETIGVKGGKNDNRRRLKIKKKKLELLVKTKKTSKQTETIINIISFPKIIQETYKEVKYQVVEEIEQNSIPIKETQIDQKIEELKTKKIISYYENKLKEIKFDLKNTIYEYNIIAKESS